jgi:putative heme iron utilization protein
MKHGGNRVVNATDDFDAKAFTKKLLREARSGALATLMRGSGDPYCSKIDVATAADGSPLLLISTFAVHTKNILVDPRVSVMLDEQKVGNPLALGRIMLAGTVAKTEDADEKRRYLDRLPGSAEYASFDDFAFYKMTLKSAHYVAGFGRIGNLKAEDIVTRVDDAAKILAGEASVIEHMNDDHAEACRLYATKLLGGQDGPWRCVGCDPEGLDLQLDRTALRLTFPRRVRTLGALRKTVIRLSEKARAAK